MLLRASSSGSDSLQSTIDDLATRKAQLETENRSQALEVLTLQNELKKLEKKGVKGTQDVAIEQLAVAERDMKKYKKMAGEFEAALQSAQEELITLKKAESLAGLDQVRCVPSSCGHWCPVCLVYTRPCCKYFESLVISNRW